MTEEQLRPPVSDPEPGPNPWPANSRFTSTGLEVAGVSAAGLASTYGTPLLVFDEDDFRARCRAFAGAFPRPMYAVKAFTSRLMVRVAQEEGLGLLSSTGGELQACLRAGADPSAIAMHGNNKSDAEIRMAVGAQVGFLMADHADELDRIDRIAREAGRVQPVMLRVTPGVSGDTHEYLDTGGLDSKFGTPIAEGRAIAAVKRATTLEGVHFVGLHAHVGSQLLDVSPFVAEIETLFDLLAEIRDALGIETPVLDVGGGFGVTYTSEMPQALPHIAATMLEHVRTCAAARGLAVPDVMVEPGRSIVANSVCTLYRVGSIKEVASGRTFVAVDGGMSDNIRPALYGAEYTVAYAGSPRSGGRATATVVGRHCESGDVLATDVELPDDLRPGDLLAFAATGAYGYSMASNYNRVGKPAVAVVSGGRSRLLFRREDDTDLDRLEIGAAPAIPTAEPPPGVLVRPAGPKDARSFSAMWQGVVAEGFVHSQRVGNPVRHYRGLFRDAWNERGAWILAMHGSEVIGLLSLARGVEQRNRHNATLGMGIAKPWRGKGIGSVLMVEAFRWAEEFGVARIALSVYPDNAPAVALYRKFGFVEEGRLVRHLLKPVGYVDEVLMARWLQ
ncbi:MAG: diaminopimelate decarboxylase [Actinomycetota bacterium]